MSYYTDNGEWNSNIVPNANVHRLISGRLSFYKQKFTIHFGDMLAKKYNKQKTMKISEKYEIAKEIKWKQINYIS